jgi:hypothetical protein
MVPLSPLLRLVTTTVNGGSNGDTGFRDLGSDNADDAKAGYGMGGGVFGGSVVGELVGPKWQTDSSGRPTEWNRPTTANELDELEQLHKSVELYLWLAHRLPESFVDREHAQRVASRLSEMIEDALMHRGSGEREKLAKTKMRQTKAREKSKKHLLMEEEELLAVRRRGEGGKKGGKKGGGTKGRGKKGGKRNVAGSASMTKHLGEEFMSELELELQLLQKKGIELSLKPKRKKKKKKKSGAKACSA